MNKKNLLLLILIISALQGCSLMRHESANISSLDLVYKNKDFSSIKHSSIGVFSSISSRRIGVISAQILSEELLREANNECFRSVYLGSNKDNLSIKDIFDIARHEKYDVVIISDVSNAVEGSDVSYSSVSERMRVFRVNEADETLIMNAKASEKGDPIFSRDYIFFKTKNKAALPLFSLMGTIGNKFARMICDRTDVKESNHKQADSPKAYTTASMLIE
jgi:hypothetical protein